MTVRELIAFLKHFDPSAPVLLATQPSYPLAAFAGAPTEVHGVVWIPDMGQPNDQPYAPREAWENAGCVA